jgi:hypothetical protein
MRWKEEEEEMCVDMFSIHSEVVKRRKHLSFFFVLSLLITSVVVERGWRGVDGHAHWPGVRKCGLQEAGVVGGHLLIGFGGGER